MAYHPALERLNAYYRDLSSGRDAQKIARHFQLPALLIIGQEKFAFASPDDVEAVYSRAMDKYRTEGVARITYSEHETTVVSIYPTLLLVKTLITRERTDGTPINRWPCSYMMGISDGDWRIDVATATPN